VASFSSSAFSSAAFSISAFDMGISADDVQIASLLLSAKRAGISSVVRTESIALQGKSAGMSLQVKSIESGK
jgi:hypothetical protein